MTAAPMSPLTAAPPLARSTISSLRNSTTSAPTINSPIVSMAHSRIIPVSACQATLPKASFPGVIVMPPALVKVVTFAVHPKDSNIVYVGAVGSSPGGGGALQRYDHRSGHIQLINVSPEPHGGIGPVDLKERFPWTFPILFSPHDPNVLYTAGNRVFRTTDEGITWEAISPDLTRNDPEKLQASGGPITKDTSGAEHYCTIYTLRESALEAGVFWAGSDDGLVHLSRDGGANWQNVTPPDLPEWSFIRTVELSPHDPATCYLAATRYKLDDNAPYLYKTTDYGAAWSPITNGIPADDFTRVIRTDPAQPGLLYAGHGKRAFIFRWMMAPTGNVGKRTFR